MRTSLHVGAAAIVLAGALASVPLFGAVWAVNTTTAPFFTGKFSITDVGKGEFTANAEAGLLLSISANGVLFDARCRAPAPGATLVQQPVHVVGGTGSKGSENTGSWKVNSKVNPDKAALFLGTFSTFMSALDASLPSRVFGGSVLFATCKVSGKTKRAKDGVHLTGKFTASVTGMIQDGPNVLGLVKGKGTFVFTSATLLTE
jgi:hypothetical protein